MLYFITAWLLLAVFSWVIGTGVLNRFRADQFERGGDRLVAALWLGILLLAVALLATSLVLPLSPAVGAGVAALLCGIALLSVRTRSEMLAGATKLTRSQLTRSHFWICLAGAIGVAALTAQPVTWRDTGLYHYGLIQWLGKFGTVPGLSLLFSNLGFSSSWLALAAPLNAEIFDARVSAVANGFALLLVGVQLIVGLSHFLKRDGRLSDGFIAAFSLLIFPIVVGSNLLSVILISPSPDIPVMFLVGVVAWSILVVSNASSVYESATRSEGSTAALVPLILATGAVTLKLTALPLLLVTGLYVLRTGGWSARRVGLTLGIVSVILAPLCLAGITVSGCPLYPSTAFCLDLPWSLPTQAATSVAKSTHAWTSWYTAPPTVHPWLWAIYRWLADSRPNQLLAVLIVLSLGSGVYLWKTRRSQPDRGQAWVSAIAGSGILFFMLTAPSFRFMLVYLLLIPILVGLHLLPLDRLQRFRRRSPWHERTLSVTSLGLAALFIALYIKSNTLSHLLLPPRMQTSQVIQKQGSDFVYFSPQPNLPLTQLLCWDAPLPCGFSVLPQVRLRQPKQGLRAGFIWDRSFKSAQ